MRHLLVIVLSAASLLAGCPKQEETHGVILPDEEDQYSKFGALMRNQNGFNDELKRLQKLHTDAPSLSYAAAGQQSSRFDLSSRIEPGRVGLALTDNSSDEEWVLWAWSDAAEPPPQVTVINNEATTGGYQLEFNVAGQALAINLTARWTQGRYLQISRELILGGLDHAIRVPEGYVNWELDGPWLPYRMLPGAQGPYGVVADHLARGDWHAAGYPSSAMAPIIAAYDKQRGFLLGVADEHPRTLDRDYLLSWRIPSDYSAGGQIEIRYRVYDPTQDLYAQAYLPSGLPLRDSIVLEPFELRSSSADGTLVEAETTEVIILAGQLIRAFHFYPRPPDPLPNGGIISASEWVSDLAELPDFIRTSTGIWEVRASDARFFDGALDAGGNIGLGARDLPEGLGVNEQALSTLAMIDPESLAIVASCDYLTLRNGDAYAVSQPDWLAIDENGNRFTHAAAIGGNSALDIRNPGVAAWAVRKMATDIADYAQIAGYMFQSPGTLDVAAQSSQQGSFYVSYPAAACLMYLKTAEGILSERGDALLFTDGHPTLSLPAFCNGYINGTGCFYSAENQPGEHISIAHANRLSNSAIGEFFGTSPYLAFDDGNLAAQVIATTFAIRGHKFTKAMEAFAGFESFATQQRQLWKAGGEMAVIHSAPAVSAYTLDDERPAECTQLIAVLPGNLAEASAVWIAFYGIGGAVAVDSRNALSVTWEGGSWEGKLPGGYWVIEHPDAERIQPGDAVLIMRRPIGFTTDSRSTSG